MNSLVETVHVSVVGGLSGVVPVTSAPAGGAADTSSPLIYLPFCLSCAPMDCEELLSDCEETEGQFLLCRGDMSRSCY